MRPKDTQLDKTDAPKDPIENQPLDWADEDIELEDRKPNLGELDEDPEEI